MSKFRHLLLGLFLFFLSFPVYSVTQSDLLSYSTGNEKEDAPRLKAITELGFQVGIQGGMIERAKKIVEQVSARANDLDRAFEFQPLMTPDGLLPPVIDKIEQGVETKNDAQRIEFFGVSYKIVRSEFFARVAPTWRDYIFVGLDESKLTIEKLPDTLHPITAHEKNAWEKAIKEGWQVGIDQSNAIYAENLQRLRRDYMGMIRYKTLESQNMVRAPILSISREVAKVSANQINIGVGVKTIEQKAQMEERQGEWGR